MAFCMPEERARPTEAEAPLLRGLRPRQRRRRRRRRLPNAKVEFPTSSPSDWPSIAHSLCPHPGIPAIIGRPLQSVHFLLARLGDICRSRGSCISYRTCIFTDNTSPKSSTDRAWKVRSIVYTLQRSFKQSFMTPPVLSFYEAIILSRNTFNQTLQP